MARRTKRQTSRRVALTRAERFLTILVGSTGPAERTQAGKVRLPGVRILLTAAEVEDLCARDLAVWLTPERLVPTEAGMAWARRRARSENPFRDQHGDVRRADPAGPAIDMAESPLLWLHRRRGSDGSPLIGEALFAAGERLRSDFTFGNMNPRVTLNWTAAVQGSRNPYGAEPGESALAARQRVRRALDRVGPELSGILIDICCFLKKLEDVERDRKWPARSAKVILTLALQRLARHYGYSDCAEGRVRKAG
jgi:hypothetical protein